MEKVKLTWRQRFEELPAYFRWSPVPISAGVLFSWGFDVDALLTVCQVLIAIFVYAVKAPADSHWSPWPDSSRDYLGGALVALVITFLASAVTDLTGFLLGLLG